jgi:transcriptional regulator with XRE-family HTH domain
MDKYALGSIGARVRKIRQDAGLTQKAFGQEVGVSLPTVNRIEQNQRSPNAELLVEISRKFTVDLNWLLTGAYTTKQNEKLGQQIPLFSKLSQKLIDNPSEDVAALLFLPDVPATAVACKSKDDACSPRVSSYDTVIFEPGDCEVGDLVVICDEWGNGLVRNMQMQGDKVVYVADNKGYEHLGDDEVSCLGKVWGLIRQLVNP